MPFRLLLDHMVFTFSCNKPSPTTMKLCTYLINITRYSIWQGRNGVKFEAYNTGYSQTVTHPSTNPARPGLTSVIRREPVHSRWYGHRRKNTGTIWPFIRGFPSTDPKPALPATVWPISSGTRLADALQASRDWRPGHLVTRHACKPRAMRQRPGEAHHHMQEGNKLDGQPPQPRIGIASRPFR